MYRIVYLLFIFPLASADGSLDTDAITSRQLMTTQPQSSPSPILHSNQPIVDNAKPGSGSSLDNNKSLLNPDGTLRVSKDTKMQVNPNGVSLKLGY